MDTSRIDLQCYVREVSMTKGIAVLEIPISNLKMLAISLK